MYMRAFGNEDTKMWDLCIFMDSQTEVWLEDKRVYSNGNNLEGGLAKVVCLDSSWFTCMISPPSG